jgi:hypothetical protein
VLFRRLSVFVGGCTLEAAEAVCVAPEAAEPLKLDLLDGLEALVDQSLAQQREEGSEGSGAGEPRFGMLQVIREYALERLDESGEAEALHRAHAACFLVLAEQTRPQLFGPDQAETFKRLEREHDNLRAALGCWLGHGEAETTARLCLALAPFWEMRGHWSEKQHWIRRALSLGEAVPPPQRAHLLLNAGHLAALQGDHTAATQLGASLSLFRAMEDQANSAEVLTQLAISALAQEQMGEAQHLFKESLTLLQASGDQARMRFALFGQARLAGIHGDNATATRLLEQALAVAQSVDNRHDIAEVKRELGWQALLLGDCAAAEPLLHEALAVQQQLQDTNCSAQSLS